MSKDEILALLPHLSHAERAEIQVKLDEIAGQAWRDEARLTDADKEMLDRSLAEYQKSPDAGSPWDEVEARILSTLTYRRIGEMERGDVVGVPWETVRKDMADQAHDA